MTNKKLKLAAMSVALTACVAAQPMAAHAVEGPDPAEDNAAPRVPRPPPSLRKGKSRRKSESRRSLPPPGERRG